MRGVTLATCATVAYAASTCAASLIVYDNTPNAGPNNAIVGGNEWADDLHMTQGGQLSSFTFEYTGSSSTSATIRFYPNNASNTLLPVLGSPLASYVVPIGAGGASASKTVDVVSGPILPADIWMSIEYSLGGSLQLHNPPVIGSSHSGTSLAVTADNFNFDWGGNFPFAVAIVPAPASGALLALAGIAATRRRR
jgi:hypothetical protein